MSVRGCLFFLLLVLLGSLAVMQCSGPNQTEMALQEAADVAPPPPPPPPNTTLPVLADLGVGGESSLVAGRKPHRFGVSAISGSGSDAIVVVWLEPKGAAREFYSLRLDAARSAVTAGPIVLTLTGLERAPDSESDGEQYTARLKITAPASTARPDTMKAPAGN